MLVRLVDATEAADEVDEVPSVGVGDFALEPLQSGYGRGPGWMIAEDFPMARATYQVVPPGSRVACPWAHGASAFPCCRDRRARSPVELRARLDPLRRRGTALFIFLASAGTSGGPTGGCAMAEAPIAKAIPSAAIPRAALADDLLRVGPLTTPTR